MKGRSVTTLGTVLKCYVTSKDLFISELCLNVVHTELPTYVSLSLYKVFISIETCFRFSHSHDIVALP